jgi:hypothetical protein
MDLKPNFKHFTYNQKTLKKVIPLSQLIPKSSHKKDQKNIPIIDIIFFSK